MCFSCVYFILLNNEMLFSYSALSAGFLPFNSSVGCVVLIESSDNENDVSKIKCFS